MGPLPREGRLRTEIPANTAIPVVVLILEEMITYYLIK